MYLIVVTFFAPPKTRRKSYRFGGEGLGYIQTADEKNHEDKCMDYFCTAQKTHFLIMTYHKNQSPFHLRIWWDGGVGSVVGDHAMVMGEHQVSTWCRQKVDWQCHDNGTFLSKKNYIYSPWKSPPHLLLIQMRWEGVDLTVEGLEGCLVLPPSCHDGRPDPSDGEWYVTAIFLE